MREQKKISSKLTINIKEKTSRFTAKKVERRQNIIKENRSKSKIIQEMEQPKKIKDLENMISSLSKLLNK